MVTLRNGSPPGSKKGCRYLRVACGGPQPGSFYARENTRIRRSGLVTGLTFCAKDSRRRSRSARIGRMAIAELVRTMGVEPIPPFGERILSPLRLPFRHVRKPSYIRGLALNFVVGLMDFFVANNCNKHQGNPPMTNQPRHPVQHGLQHEKGKAPPCDAALPAPVTSIARRKIGRRPGLEAHRPLVVLSTWPPSSSPRF